MPRLAVLMPVRNGEQHLPRALSSTLAALPRDAELVVVDDGSTDGTAALLSAAAERDRRLRVLRGDAPLGVAAALNLALTRSDSELVARMDADDVVLPGRFGRQAAALARTDFVFGSSVLIDGNGRPIGLSTPTPVRPDAAGLHLLIGNFFSHPTMAARRGALDALGGYRRTVVEDFDLWLRAAAVGFRLRQTVLPVLGYRRHAAQVTASWRPPIDDPVLDEPFSALLPEHLRGDAPVLRRSAVSRHRDEPHERAAWQRLVPWLRGRAAALPALDAAVLRRRIAQHSPR